MLYLRYNLDKNKYNLHKVILKKKFPNGVLAGYGQSKFPKLSYFFFKLKIMLSQDRDSVYLSIHWLAYLLLCTRNTKLIYI